jgi:tyrosine-protein kinase Etk/Wzc
MGSHQESQPGMLRNERSLLDYVRVVLKYWKLEVGLFLGVCLLVGLHLLRLPAEYEATASLLPPPQTGGGAGSLRSVAMQAGLSGPLPWAPGTNILVGILMSRTMQDDIIKKFNLVKAYGLEGSKTPMRAGRAKLAAMTDIKVSKEGVVSVTAWAYEPGMAADIANFYVDNLDWLNTSINATEAGRSRLFLQGRVAEAQRALRGAEDRLRQYQSRSKAVVIAEQTKAAIESVARLEGQILAAEVQLKTLQTYATERHPDIIRLQEGIEEMRSQLKRTEYGRAIGNPKPAPGGAAGDFSVALGSVPSTGLELVRQIREVKMQETIFTLLAEQLEQAKITEARDTPTVRILDRAVVPEWKSRPHIRPTIERAGLLSIVVGISLALFLDWMERRRTRKL